MWQKIKPFIIGIVIALGVGGLSALLTRGSMTIYQQLSLPTLAPQPVVFPIVWSILFVLMGISSVLVYKKGGPGSKSALVIYGLQLVFNFLWSIIFFNLHNYLAAFIWLVALWVLIILMIYKFYQISPLAAYLQIPYLLWVSFAGYLNLMIYILNR